MYESPSKVHLNNFDSTEGFTRGAGRIKNACWYFTKMIFFLTAFPFPQRLKSFLLKRFGAKIGKGIVIKPRVNIHMPWKLEVGDYAWLGEEVFILNFERVTIGKNACISQRVFLCGGNHDYRDPAFKYRNGPITIGDGSWIGANCFIGPDITTGIDTVVAAGSVVTSNLNGNSIYKGNPAKYVKPRWN